jgi:hypothetical protein
MMNLSKFFESPFEKIVVGKDKQFKFYEDHTNRLIQAVANGEPFGSLVDPTNTALTGLKTSLGGQSSTLAQRESKTMTVDIAMDNFKTAVKLREANILVVFPKDHPVYQEFFPQGKTEYDLATKANVEKLMTRIITAIDNHKTQLGQPLLDEFMALRTSYVTARDEQLQKMGDTEASKETWESCLAVMQAQAFTNLLSIANVYKGKPDKVDLFFDEAIVQIHRHVERETGELPYELLIEAGTTKAANLSFSVDDEFEIVNISEVPVYYYGALTANEPCPPAATELLPGETKITNCELLGAPVNKYLLFTNKDTTSEAEVEITMLIN